MILVDTSVWIDHFRKREPDLAEALARDDVLMHDYTLGELALGNFRNRPKVFDLLDDLKRAPLASSREVLDCIESERLYGTGVGYVDVHLLVSTGKMAGTSLWTRDKRLASVAGKMGLLSELSS